MATIKKAQNGATKDSTAYYSNKARLSELKGALSNNPSEILRNFNASDKAKKDQSRQKYKGKPGYDANGFPKKKNGGSIAKDGKWIQKATASIKKRGTAGKCTPITKPGCTGKAKTLALTFKKMSKAKKKK
jgi:hypothetical protein